MKQTELAAAVKKITTPLEPRIVTVTLSPREILENVESLIGRLSQHEIQLGAGDYLEEHDADHLLDLSSELRQASQIIFDVVNQLWQSQAEETLELACE